MSFIDDTYSKLSNVSGQLNYRVTDNFKIWGAVEYKQDKDRFYWGTPLVPANAPGIVPTNGIVSGIWTNYYLNGHAGHAESGHDRRPDAATRTTTCSTTTAARRSCGCAAASSGTSPTTSQLKSQVYGYDANATGSTTRSTRSTIPASRTGRSTANVFRSITIRGSTATSPT